MLTVGQEITLMMWDPLHQLQDCEKEKTIFKPNTARIGCLEVKKKPGSDSLAIQLLARSSLKCYTLLDSIIIERFSTEFCKTNLTKVFTLANHKGNRQYSEPIKTLSNCIKLTRSIGNWILKTWHTFFQPIA